MKERALRYFSNPLYIRIQDWARLITITGSAQILVQAMALAGGIIVIRLLSPEEYALYTIANTMLGTMLVLADGGISTSMLAQGGKVWQHPQKLGRVLTTGLQLRRKFALYSLIAALPILIFLLNSHEANWQISILITLSLIPVFVTSLSGVILQAGPKLHQQINSLQRNQVAMNFGRLLLLASILFFFPLAFLAILSMFLPQLWANRQLKKASSEYIDWDQQADEQVKKETLKLVRRILPGSIYYCLSGQLTIWLITLFGSTLSVAQAGALSRLAMMLNIFSVLFGTLIAPRFARLPADSKLLLNRYLQMITGLVLLAMVLISMTWIFHVNVLWILGKDYSGLKTELVLNIAGSCLGMIAGACFTLYTSRGWAVNPFLSIPLSIVSIIAGMVIFDLSTIQGILSLNLFVSVVQVLLNGVYGFWKIKRMSVSIIHHSQI
jgi:O-antigen/teichoic acid export membrane protein